jgi:hypothetical protein
MGRSAEINEIMKKNQETKPIKENTSLLFVFLILSFRNV